MKAVSRTEAFARAHFDCLHSNDLSGAETEHPPRWAQAWFPYFEGKENATNVAARTEAARLNNRQISWNLMGASTPLGYAGDGPADLRTKTTVNNVPPGTRSTSVGGVTHIPEAIPLDKTVEGRGDVQNALPPNHRVPIPAGVGQSSGSGSGTSAGTASRTGATQSVAMHTLSFSTPRSRASYTGTLHRNMHVVT